LKALCIYNPQAGNGKAAKQLDYVKSLFDKYDIQADIKLTEYPHHGKKLIEESDLSQYDALLVAGGDGSFFDTVNAYMKQSHQIPVGLIPVGTGNSLSKDINLNIKNLESYVETIHIGQIKHFDLGEVQTNNHQFYFANMMGFGFTTDVTLTGIKYKFLGDFAYTLGVLLNVLRLKSYPLKMVLNNQTYDLDNTYVTVSISKYAGGTMKVAPQAVVNDGLMDVVVVNKVSRFKLLKTFPKIFNGSYIKSPFVYYYQTDQIQFSSKHQKIVSPDGEIMGELPVAIKIKSKALPIFVSKELI
jgi:YegS/Rv2252/BmrU family lipid kinase